LIFHVDGVIAGWIRRWFATILWRKWTRSWWFYVTSSHTT